MNYESLWITFSLSEPPEPHCHAENVVIMFEDLSTFCRQVLQHLYFKDFANQIYITSPTNVRSITSWNHHFKKDVFLDITVKTLIDTCLSPKESILRQRRLLAPFFDVHNHAQIVRIRGVDEQIMVTMTDSLTRRTVWLEAVGWDLFNLMQSEKANLDIILNSQRLTDTSKLIQMYHGYTEVMYLGMDSYIFKRHFAYLLGSTRSLPPNCEANLTADSWQMGVILLIFDAANTSVRLAYAAGWNRDVRDLLSLMRSLAYGQLERQLPGHFKATHRHYNLLLSCPRASDSRHASSIPRST